MSYSNSIDIAVHQIIGWAYNLDKLRQIWISSPELNFGYNFSHEKHIFFSDYLFKLFGNFMRLYRGAGLLNYHALQVNNANIRQNKTQLASIDYAKVKLIKLLFFYFIIAYIYNHQVSYIFFSLCIRTK